MNLCSNYVGLPHCCCVETLPRPRKVSAVIHVEKTEELFETAKLPVITKCQLTRRGVLLFEPLRSRIPEKAFDVTTEHFTDPGKMAASIQIISTPTADTPGTTLVLQTVSRNYVFGNHAEGTQRALTQQGQRLTKVQDFFMTGRTEWSNVGGLVGMVLTLADSATTRYESAMETYNNHGKKKEKEPVRPKLNIYGPPNLKHLLGTCRRFIFRKGVPLNATEFKDAAPTKSDDGKILPSWQDSFIQVWALSVAPKGWKLDHRIASALASDRNVYDTYQNNFEDHKAQENETSEDREARYDRIRTALVNQMFDSTWSMDTLVEQHISKVEMPTSMFVRNPHTNKIEKYTGPMPGGKEPLPDITVLVRTPWPGALVATLPPTRPFQEAVSYIVRTHPARGKFDVKRAKELGVTPGPNFSRLTAGDSVQNVRGETITPEMVMGADRPGQGVAILDVPSLAYLEVLIERKEFKSSHIMEGIQAVVWLLGPGLSGHPTLQKFMDSLNQVQHVISSVDDCPNRLSMDSVAAQTVRLSQIDADRYRLPFHDNTTLPQNRFLGSGPRKEGPLNNVTIAERGMAFKLMPNFSMIKDSITPLVNVTTVQQSTAPDVILLGNSARESVEKDKNALEAWRRLVARPDTEVITLGTGSASPSKYRNVSATLVRVPGIGNYLFDCGENTLGQLQRVFNPEELVEVLQNLRMIWISHLHADHHLGTASLIRAWYAVKHKSVAAMTPVTMNTISTTAPMYGLSVISHEAMLKWLWEYSSIEDFGYSRIIPLQILPVRSGSESGSTLQLSPAPARKGNGDIYELKHADYKSVLGLSDIQACRVSHCHGAMAVSLTFPESSAAASTNSPSGPLKVSYSGDCRPSQAFTRIGANSTVLIHEATFDDELKGDALAKKHSTTSEALDIGARMGAKAVVLTHFSQRYQKIPVLQADELAAEEVPIATAIEDVVDDEAEDTAVENMDIVPAPANTSASLLSTATPARVLPHQRDGNNGAARVIKVRSPDMKVAVAFDYMRVRLGDIAQMEKFNPALSKLLVADDEPEGEGEGEGEINGNGKKTSGDDGEGKKKKKSKRNN
jgi:ribonuclease Z